MSKFNQSSQTIFRTCKDKNNPYVQINKTCLFDSRLSLKAKGLLCIMLSMPDNWEFRRSHLLTLFAGGERALKSALKELSEFGYITISHERDERGRIKQWITSVYETPQVRNVTPQIEETQENQGLQVSPDVNSSPSLVSDPNLPEVQNALLESTSTALEPQGFQSDSPEVRFPHVENAAITNNKSNTKNYLLTNNKNNIVVEKVIDSTIGFEKEDVVENKSVVIDFDRIRSELRLIGKDSWELANQVKFHVARRNQSKFTPEWALNIALKLIREGTWGMPKGYSPHWEKSLEEISAQEKAAELDDLRTSMIRGCIDEMKKHLRMSR